MDAVVRDPSTLAKLRACSRAARSTHISACTMPPLAGTGILIAQKWCVLQQPGGQTPGA